MMEEMNNDVQTTENFENMDMESMLEKYAGEEIHKGKVVTGTIVGANEDGWLVDVGYKCEGFLPRREWTHKILVEEEEEPSINDEIQVQVINIRHGEDAGAVNLTDVGLSWNPLFLLTILFQ